MLWDMLGGTHSSSTCFMRTDTLQASLGTSLLQVRPSQASAQQNRVRWWKKEQEEERKRKGREARAGKLVVNQNWNRGEEATGRVKKKQREVESGSATAEKSCRRWRRVTDLAGSSYWLSICSWRRAMLPCSSSRFSLDDDWVGSSFFT